MVGVGTAGVGGATDAVFVVFLAIDVIPWSSSS
jgi:hypothetical protein